MKAKSVDLNALEKLPYLSPSNAAIVTGLPVSMIRKGIKAGKIPVISSGRCSYIIMAQLPAALEKMAADSQQ